MRCNSCHLIAKNWRRTLLRREKNATATTSSSLTAPPSKEIVFQDMMQSIRTILEENIADTTDVHKTARIQKIVKDSPFHSIKSTVHEFVYASDSKTTHKFALCDCRGSTQDCPGIAIFMREHGGNSFLCNSCKK